MTLRVGIIGCGLTGRRRAAIAHEAGHRVVAVADLDAAKAAGVAQESGAKPLSDWRRLVERADIDAVVVATFNAALAPVTIASLESGKHVLCEKPLGRNFAEAEQMVAAARKAGRILKTGFNHRHHPAIWTARELCRQGDIGPLVFIRAVYGHGGRPGYDKEWRADGALAGGGELLDQGVHILDLCRWFMGDFAEAFALTGTFAWNLDFFPAAEGPGQLVACSQKDWPEPQQEKTEMKALCPPLPPVNNMTTHVVDTTRGRRLEDNAFVLLRAKDGGIVQFHTSGTQWANRFSFEVFGRTGCVAVEGLGGSYGTETLTVSRRRNEGGRPEQEIDQFAGPDDSWRLEWQEFVSAISEGREPLASGQDGLETMRLVGALYESAWTGQAVELPIKEKQKVESSGRRSSGGKS